MAQVELLTSDSGEYIGGKWEPYKGIGSMQIRPLHDCQHCCVDKSWSSSRLRTMKPSLAFRAALGFTYALGPATFARSITAWLRSVRNSTRGKR